jgi:hypothetical protein
MSTPSGMERDPRSGPQEWTYPTEPRATTGHHHAGHEPDPQLGGHGEHGEHGGHGLMMIVCCIPMLAIAGLLFITGVAGSGVIVAALLCTAMMAAMMFAMPGGHGGHGRK